jgi:hypothetical protein
VSRKHALIGVEGPNDSAFVGKVLNLLNFKKFDGKESNLDSFWAKFRPIYPKKGGDLYERLDMPSIFFTDTLSVAIYAGGGSNLSRNLSLILHSHPPYQKQIEAFGIIADADKDSPNNIAKKYSKDFQVYFPGFPTVGGNIDLGYPRTGIYVLPDNAQQGVLENIICSCGDYAYPLHMEKAALYLAEFDGEHKPKWKPFDDKKALIATVVSVLKPGKTNTVSIKDNNWISQNTLSNVPALGNFVTFIKKLLDLEIIDI